ncbi:hypothetical protein K8O84_15540 [Cupriavidus pauculus]|jgi:hypothetical protein|nr:hypothetical protein F7R19_00350 [Cupriavidus pauculus]UAK99379.1 hypothetical protein K8O84_15540 [Cupriavidus pauculus]
MKVKQNRHGQTLRRAVCARVAWLAGVSLLWAAIPAASHAQSAGMAHLLHPNGQQQGSSQAQSERNRQPARRANQSETERDMAERAGRQGQRGGNPRLSPDERKSLRKNLYDLSREMYRGS